MTIGKEDKLWNPGSPFSYPRVKCFMWNCLTELPLLSPQCSLVISCTSLQLLCNSCVSPMRSESYLLVFACSVPAWWSALDEHDWMTEAVSGCRGALPELLWCAVHVLVQPRAAPDVCSSNAFVLSEVGPFFPEGVFVHFTEEKRFCPWWRWNLWSSVASVAHWTLKKPLVISRDPGNRTSDSSYLSDMAWWRI